MKYRILLTKDDTVKNLYYYSSHYIDSGLKPEELAIIDNIKVDSWEEALNNICNKLNLRLISVYNGINKLGFPRIVHIFEEIKDDTLLT